MLVQKFVQKTNYKKITDVIRIVKGSKTVLEGDFNLDVNTQEGEDFVKALRIENIELRTNLKHYTTRGSTTIGSIFSNKTVKTSLCKSF